MDTASLRISVNTSDVKTASNDLDKLSKTSARTEQEANKVTKSFSALNAVLTVGAVSAVAAQYIKLADTMTGIQSKLKLVTSSTTELATAQNELFKIAQTTRQGLAETVDTYSNFAVAMGEMGKSQKEILRVTETVNKAIAISGGTAQQAAAATMQLGQAFASGTLRGDELNSILENSKGLAQAIADGMGVPIGKLRTLGSEGKITAEILAKALENSANSVDKKFSKVGVTVDQSMTMAKNSIMGAVGEFDRLSGASATISKNIQSFSVYLDKNNDIIFESLGLVKNLALAASAFYGTTLAVTAVKALIATEFWVKRVTVAQVAMNVTAWANPWVILAAAIGGATFALSEYFDLQNEINKNNAKINSTPAFLNDLKAVQGKSHKEQLHGIVERSKALQQEQIELIKTYNIRKGYAYQGSKNSEEQKAREERIASISAEQESLVKYSNTLKDLMNKPKAEKTPPLLDPNAPKTPKGKTPTEIEAERISDLTKQLNEDLIKSQQEVTLSELDEFAKRRKQLEFDRDEDLKKFKGVKDLEDKINQEYSNKSIIISQDEKKAKEQLEKENIDETAKQQADSALAFYDLIQTDSEKVNDKFLSLYEVNKDLFSTDQLNLFFDKWNKSIDDTFEKVKEMDFSASIELDPAGLEGTAKAIAGIGKQLDQLTKAEEQYQKNKQIVGKDREALALADKEHTKDQINGYSQLAGAMSSMFAQGSREAEAFKAVQSGLALINAVTAVMNAGTNGDGYTAVARMAAVAAYASQMLGSIGLALNSGGGSTSSDAFASQNANTGTGSVLGDTTAQSESISNSMEILSDIAKPEFALMSQMNKSLISIDSKIAGLSAKILQESGFAVGSGFVGGSKELGKGALSFYDNTLGKLIDNSVGKIDLLGAGVNNFVAGGISKIISGIGGKKTVGLKDAGITFGDQFLQGAMSSLTGNSYQVVETIKKSWFNKSTTLSTGFSALDDYTKNQFQLILGNIYDVVDMSGEALGVASTDVDTQLNSFVVSLGKISLLGKTGDEINTTLTAIFGKVGDDLATKVFPAMVDFQTVGEGMFETMTRVATGMEEANYYVDRLGKQFIQTIYTDIGDKQGDVGLEALRQSILGLEISGGVSDIIRTLNGDIQELYDTYTALDLLRFDLSAIGTSTDALTSSMLYGAGGISALSDATQSYIENYLSESEQLAYNTSIMTDAFSDLGLTIPTTKQGFTDLLKSIDVTTESGQDLYGRLILLSDGFNTLVEDSDKVKSSLFDNIQSFIDSIMGKGSSDAPKAFSDFSTSFNSMIDAIANGSSNLEEVGQTALDNAQNYLNTVTATATAGRDIEFAKAMLVNKFSGVIATPDTSLNTINNTLNNNNAVLVAELQSLKFELNSIKSMTINQTATQISTLGQMRTLVGLTATA